MNRLLHTLLNLAWALWLGGLIMLFLAVGSLFQTFANDHATAGMAAAAIFRRFTFYRLGLIVATLLLAAGLSVRRRGGGIIAAFLLFALAALAAGVSGGWLAPRIEHLRVDHLTQSAEFARLHGLSMTVYLVETLLVLAAGLILPAAEAQTEPRAAKDANIHRPSIV